jgi:anti-sigma regulatory factor (Ser/Thr protein kinase)
VSEETLRLTLPARPENVALVRHSVAGLAEALGMEEAGVADLKTVVGEACMNAVVHAYEDGEGPLEVTVTPDESGISLAVRDYGTGIRPRVDVEGSSLRLGLPLIAALSESFEIHGGPGQGTEVRMRFPFSSNGAAPTGEVPTPAVRARGAEISVGQESLVGPVVSRVVAMLAARSDLPVDRLSDAMLLGDAVSAHAPAGFTDGRVHLVVEDADGAVEVRVGPMSEGSGKRIRRELELPGLGSSIERLADSVEVEEGSDGEYLTLRVASSSNAA